MNDRDYRRISGTPKSTAPLYTIQKIDYVKKKNVDYDVTICIPSYNRYEKIYRLINQFFTQETKYTFKIILLNDGSDDMLYDTLSDSFQEIIYIKNDRPNGKMLHWYSYNQLWLNLRNIKCHAVLQMDDDFIISNNFLNTIVDLFFKKKEENGNIMAIAPHLWSFKENNVENWWKRTDFVDGIALIDIDIIDNLNYELHAPNHQILKKCGTSAMAWSQISIGIKNYHGIVLRTKDSLVYHDGNDDSKLHSEHRKEEKNGIYTQRYIENI